MSDPLAAGTPGAVPFNALPAMTRMAVPCPVPRWRMISDMRNAWKEELALLLGILLFAIVAGAITDRTLPCLLAGLLGYLGWHLYQLLRLPQLPARPHAGGPLPYGLWRESITAIQSRLEQDRGRNTELENLAAGFSSIINALPEAVITLDPADRVSWANPAATSLLDITWPTAAGSTLTALIRDPVVREYMERADFTQPLVCNSPSDRARILSLTIMPPDAVSGQRLVVAREITRQYHLDAAKRDFVANISHELRTPLTVISGLAEQLGLDSRDTPELQRPAQLMLQQVQRMNEMITDLLILSRLESQPASESDEPVDIENLLESLVEEARALSGNARHVVRLEIQSAACLLGDSRELRTAFTNLVTNAIRHTPPRSEVRVSWRVDGDDACFSVTDTGAGIAARHIPRLTERFYRVDPSRSRDTGGSGLGLAIVKHILDRHDAKLEISSTVGGGSTFSCCFPPQRIAREDR
jgi:two-component system phosphate regulon sensor histidine kinase PhoR